MRTEFRNERVEVITRVSGPVLCDGLTVRQSTVHGETGNEGAVGDTGADAGHVNAVSRSKVKQVYLINI